MKKKLLFVCTNNMNRSVSAEKLFDGNEKFEAKSAGTSYFAGKKVNELSLEWADYIVVMEEKHKEFILENFPEFKNKKIFVLDIPDFYNFGDKKLIEILKLKLNELGLL